jgi:hypothetical protein
MLKQLILRCLSTQQKVDYPPWWYYLLKNPNTNEIDMKFLEFKEDSYPVRFVIRRINKDYPNLVWNKDIISFKKYTIIELKIMLASITGKATNGTREEILYFLQCEINIAKRSNRSR